MVFSLFTITAFADTEDDQVDSQAWYDDVIAADEEASEFYIGTAGELAYLATLVNAGTDNFRYKTIKLTANIDITDFNNESNGDGSGWMPIGSYSNSKSFRGIFDGDGHIINGLTINRAVKEQGLFGHYIGGEVKNLGLTNVDMNVAGDSAAIMGFASAATINNCFVEGKIQSSGSNVGGFVGYDITETGTIKNSVSFADVSGTSQIGGIGGSLGAKVVNCYVTGEITGSSYIAGISGRYGQQYDSVVLSPKILATSTFTYLGVSAGRITSQFLGWPLDNGESCFGWNGTNLLSIEDTVVDPNRANASNLDGQDIGSDDIYNGTVWTLADFDDEVWNIETGKLPTLKVFSNGVQPSAIPAYILEDLDLEDDTEPSVSISGDETIITGADAKYSVSVNNMSKLATATLWFEVEDKFFTGKEFAGLEGFSLIGDVAWTQDGDKWIGRATLSNLEGDVDIDEATSIFDMTFASKEGELGETSVKLTEVKLSGYDENNEAVYIETIMANDVVSTSITEAPVVYSPYDVNRDGVVDQLDITTAQLYYMATDGDSNWSDAILADVNGDEVVDILDLILILNNIDWEA